MIKNIIIGLIFLAQVLFNCSWAANIDTELSTDKLALGDSLTVTYTLNNKESISPDFSPLQKDFRILNTSYGNAINIINDITSTKTFWRLRLAPKKIGTVSLPEINFGNEKSITRRITVTATATTFTSQASKNSDVFVRASLDTTSAFVQSQVLYHFKLFYSKPLREPQLELPKVKDVTFFQLGDGKNYQTTINNQLYYVTEKNFAVFFEKPGISNLSPFRLHALIQNENLNDIDDPFNLNSLKPLIVETKSFNIKINAIPANYPNTPWLPAKKLSLTEEWSDTSSQWEEGKPIIRTIKLTAEGLRADQLPDLAIEKINGMNLYVDSAKRTNQIQGDSVLGILEQKVTYIPNVSQAFTIPRLKINWWNTNTQTTTVAALNSLPIQVKKVLTQNTESQPMISKSLTLNNISKPFYLSSWFWVASFLLIVWILTLFILFTILGRRKTKKNISKKIPHPNFRKICEANQALQAQQYLLTWAKDYFPGIPLNLALLKKLIQDPEFQTALENLEHALYDKKTTAWDGTQLLKAFLKIKKLPINNLNQDDTTALEPLPPLNPK